MKENKIAQFVEESILLFPQVRQSFAKPFFFKGDMKITPNHRLCLFLIHVHKNITMSQLAKHLSVSNQQLTRIVDSLVERDWVERAVNEQNRRQILLQLTSNGLEMIRENKKMMMTSVSSFFSTFTEEELEECIAHFHAVNTIFRRKKGE